METFITHVVSEELDRLRQYLATQPAELKVRIDSTIPADRYLIPDSLILIVQHAQRENHYPLPITIRFLKYKVEISYPRQPRQIPDENLPDIGSLVTLYRNYFCLPEVHHTDDKFTITIPLFI